LTAGIDLALALIEDDCGSDVAKDVARDMVVYHRRLGGQSQYSTMLQMTPSSGRVREVLCHARAHLNEPLSVERLADVAGVGLRQFSRIFLTATGTTPAKAVERLRLGGASENRGRIGADREDCARCRFWVGRNNVPQFRQNIWSDAAGIAPVRPQ
jgi:transcriptional regulator GlxA family with amidase domain